MHNDRLALALEFIKEAKIDVSIAELILNDLESTGNSDGDMDIIHGKSRRTIFFLQQACEKALKAYFIGIFVDTLATISYLTPREYPGSQSRKYEVLLKKARNYLRPIKFGHDFRKFFKYMDEVYAELSEGNLAEYVGYILNKKSKEFQSSVEYASLIQNLADTLGVPQEKLRFEVEILFKTMLEFIENYKPPINVQRDKQKLEDTGDKVLPCIKASALLYHRRSKVIDKNLKYHIRNALQVYKGGLDSLALVLSNYSPEIVSELSTLFVKGMLKPVLGIELHMCLSRYEALSRYPPNKISSEDSGGIPKEDLDINSLIEALEAITDIIEAVEDVIFFFESIQSLSTLLLHEKNAT